MRTVGLIALSALLAVVTNVATAQQYPNRPVQVLVGNGPGSSPDIAARLPLAKVSAELGQSFVVVNRPGASGAIAAQALANAAPDGYTLSVASDSTYTSVPIVLKDIGFDPEKMTVIAPIGEIGSAVLVNADLGVKTLDEFVALAKSKPGQLNYSMFDKGHMGQLWMEALFQRLGVKVEHVPYKSGPELVQAAASGQVQITISSYTSAAGAIEAGRLLPILFTGPRYQGSYSNVPHQAQLFPELADPTTAMILIGPSGLPIDIVKKLNASVTAAVKSPDTFSALEKSGLTPMLSSPEEVQANIVRKREAFARLIKQLAEAPK